MPPSQAPSPPTPLRSLAERYVRDLGYSVVPLKAATKGPPLLPEWKPYTQRRPVSEELDSWFSDGLRNIAVVCGQVSGGLVVIDFDDARAFHYCFGQVDKLAAETPVAVTAKGFHVYMLIRGGARPKNYTLRNGSTSYLPVDVKGEGGYVVAPPSVHPTGAQYRFLANHEEIAETRQEELDRTLAGYAEEWPVVERTLQHWKEGNRHNLVLGLVKFLSVEMRFADERIERMVRGICRVAGIEPSYEGELGRQVHEQLLQLRAKGPGQLASVKFLGEELYGKLRPLVPRRPRRHSGAKKEEEENFRFETYLELPDGRVAEEVVTPEGERFVLYDPATDRWEIVPEIVGDGEAYRPRPIIPEERMAITIPDGVEEYESTQKLLEEMDTLARTVYDPGTQDVMFRVWCRLALSSWIIGELEEGLPERYAPILPALGPPAAGKGRLLTVCRHFFYRSILFQKTKRVPSIFRTLQPYHYATLLLEEADVDDSTESSDLIEFLNSRASGHPAVRWSSDAERSNWFLNFGYTILALRRPYEDAGLTSRTIPYRAESTYRDLPLIATPEFAAAAKILTRKLLLWRLRHIGRIRRGTLVMPTSFRIEGMDGAHRVRAAFLPLLALKEEDPAIAEDAEELVQEIQQRVVVDRAESFEGQLLNVVYSVLEDPETEVEWDGAGHRLVFTQEVRPRGGGPPESEAMPVNCRWLVDRLNGAFSSVLIAQAWRGFQQGIKARDRYGRRRFGSILVVTSPERLGRLFLDYVPGAEPKLDRFSRQTQRILTETPPLGLTGGGRGECPDKPDKPDKSAVLSGMSGLSGRFPLPPLGEKGGGSP